MAEVITYRTAQASANPNIFELLQTSLPQLQQLLDQSARAEFIWEYTLLKAIA